MCGRAGFRLTYFLSQPSIRVMARVTISSRPLRLAVMVVVGIVLLLTLATPPPASRNEGDVWQAAREDVQDMSRGGHVKGHSGIPKTPHKPNTRNPLPSIKYKEGNHDDDADTDIGRVVVGNPHTTNDHKNVKETVKIRPTSEHLVGVLAPVPADTEKAQAIKEVMRVDFGKRGGVAKVTTMLTIIDDDACLEWILSICKGLR